MNALLLVVCASIACAATAQQLTVAAATPLIVSAQGAGTTSTQSVPVGLLAALGQVNTSAGGANAVAAWEVTPTPVSLSFHTWQMAAVVPQATAPATASAGPHEYLLHLSSATPMSMLISAHQWFDLSPGSPLPVLQVDVLDDGVPEFVVTSTATGPSWPIAVVSVGPQRVPIRVRTANLAPTAGAFAGSRLTLTVTPNNALDITRVVVGCSGYQSLQCHPSFVGTGVDFWASNGGSEPFLLVLGLALQPAVLPAYLGVPCILAPSPDVVVLATAATTLPFTLPLPPAVRPVTVYAQVLQLPGSLLLVTDAFRISAY